MNGLELKHDQFDLESPVTMQLSIQETDCHLFCVYASQSRDRGPRMRERLSQFQNYE